MRTGEPTGWPEQPEGTSATRTVGADREPSHPAETAAGLIAPIFVYPLLESAVRGARGRTPAEHRDVLGRLWARFASVAATNPHAWSTDPPTDPEAIATPSPANRLVAEPYTKLMTANIQVDQGAALLLCSAAEAQRAGIARERWVVVHATAAAHDHWFTGEREHLHRSPAIAACGRAALAHAGTEIDDVALLDLYSCFPAAVQIAGDALGVDPLTDPRPPTVTGGLTFAGGPANDYVTHALATMVGRLREQPGARGLCTAVGWYLTKHAVAVLGGPGAPAPGGEFAHHDVQEQVDALPRRAIAADVAATAPAEAFTALYDRDGTPTMAIVAALLDDGRRALGACHDRVAIGELLADDALGRPVRLDGAAGVTPA
jgi:acetyl-CoA C-acetyltransferase